MLNTIGVDSISNCQEFLSLPTLERIQDIAEFLAHSPFEQNDLVLEKRISVYGLLSNIVKGELDRETLDYIIEYLPKFVKGFLHDMQSKSEELKQACIRCMGYFTHRSSLVHSYTEKNIDDILAALENSIVACQNKTTCNLGLWCIGVQSFPSKQKESLAVAVIRILENSSFNSATIELEALSALEHLLSQQPHEIRGVISRNLPVLSSRILSEKPKVREKVHQILDLLISHFDSIPSSLSKILFDDLISNDKAKIKDFKSIINENSDPISYIRFWGQIAVLLGQYLLKDDIINILLKIPEKTFVNSSSAVRIATFEGWKHLINNFATLQGSLSHTKRLKLLLAPFLNCIQTEKDKSVLMSCFSSWVHLLNQFDPNDLVKSLPEAVFPIVSKVFQASSDYKPLLLELSLKTVADMIACPKSPPIHNNADALSSKYPVQVLPIDENKLGPLEHLKDFLDLLSRTFIYLNSLNNAKDEIVNISEYILSLWQGLVFRIGICCEDLFKKQDNSNIRDVFSLIMKFIVSIPDRNEKRLAEISKKSMQMIETVLDGINIQRVLSSSLCIIDINEHQYLPIVFMVHCILKIAEKMETENSDMFLALFRRLVNGVLSTVNPLENCFSVLVAIRDVITKPFKIRFELLFGILELIVKEHNNFVHDDETSLRSVGKSVVVPFFIETLLLPLRCLIFCGNERPSASLLEISRDMCQAFQRWSILRFGDPNSCAQTVCSHLNSIFYENDSSELEHGALEYIVGLLKPLVETLDLNLIRTPNRKRKRTNHPALGVLEVVSQCESKLMEWAKEKIICNKSTGSSEDLIPSPFIIEIMEMATSLLKKINYRELMDKLLSILSSSFVIWLRDPKPILPGIDIKGKLTVKYEDYLIKLREEVFSLWDELSSCVKRCRGGVYDSDTLQQLAPILEVVLTSKHRHLKNCGVEFWNFTFGVIEEDRNTSLQYPPSLIPVFRSLKEKIDIHVPYWDSALNEITQKRIQEIVVEEDVENSPVAYEIVNATSLATGVRSFRTPLKDEIQKISDDEKKRDFRLFKGSPISSLSFAADPREKFVRVEDSPKPKKRILTEHQRELKMEQERPLPTVYSALDPPSLDVPDDIQEISSIGSFRRSPTPFDPSYKELLRCLDSMSKEGVLEGFNVEQLHKILEKLSVLLGATSFALQTKK